MWPTFYIPSLARQDDPSPLVDSDDLNCSYSQHYVELSPSVHIPDARVGDLAVVITIYTFGGSTSYQTDPHTLPSGWKWLRREYRAGWSVQYKILEASDLASNTRWVHRASTNAQGTAGNGYICAHIWTFRNADTVLPLDDLQTIEHTTVTYTGTNAVRGAGGPGPVYVYDNYQWMFDIVYYTRGGALTGDYNNLERLGNSTAELARWDHYANDFSSAINRFVHATVVRGYRDTAENLFPNESETTSFGGWTASGCTLTQGSSTALVQRVAIAGGGGASPPYAEKEVDLVAGQVYTFNAMLENDTGYSGASYMYSSVVTPSAAEFGAAVFVDTRTPHYTNDQSAKFGSGRGVWWDSCLFSYDFDGVPAAGTTCNTIWFTAPETGTYKFRVGISNSNGTPTAPASSVTRYINAASLYKGYVAAQWTASGSNEQYRTSGPFYWFKDTGANGQSFTQTRFAVVRAGQRPPAIMHTTDNEMTGARVDSDGLTVRGRTFQRANDGAATADSTRLAYPSISGVTQKYYAEFTAGAARGSGFWGAIHVRDATKWFPHQERNWTCYSYESIGRTWADSATVSGYATWTTGDVIGVALDFLAGQIKWYKNGTLIRTDTIDSSVPHEVGVSTAWSIGTQVGVTHGSDVVANLRGPFSYKPSGFSAWDIHNEVV